VISFEKTFGGEKGGDYMATREKLLIFTLIFNLLCITCICDEKLVNIEGRVLLYKAYKGFHYFLNSDVFGDDSSQPTKSGPFFFPLIRSHAYRQ